MMSTLNTSDLCPLTTRLLPKELSHAFGIADEQGYDSREELNVEPSAAAANAPVGPHVDAAGAQAGSNAGAQLKRKASEQQQASLPAAASSVQQPTASLPQSVNVAVAETASLHGASVMQAPSTSQQQATSSISAGLQQAAVVGGQLRGFPTAYISSHSLLPYAQQTVALPHLSGALPVAMYSPADLSAVMALQQQQQQQLDEAEELQARALKRPRLVWTPQLHKLFEEAVQKIGINKAVPKTIMQMMKVDGLTRENVASHLQKYRLSLRKGPDGEFITTVTEGTETSAPEAANSAGGTTAGARTANTATAARGSGSSDAAGDSAGAAAAAGDAAGGVSSDVGTGAVAGSRGDAGTEAGSGAQSAAAATAGPAAGGSTGVAAGDMGQQQQTAAAVAAATAALADAAAGASGAATADAAT